MSETTSTRDPEHPEARLVDIVVEEVSLVDQAANKRQFLIIKRARDTMTNGVVKKGAEGSSTPNDGAAGAGNARAVSDATLDALERVAKAIGEVADEIDEPSDIARLVAIAEQLNALVESVLEDADADEEEETETDGGTEASKDASSDVNASTDRSKLEASFAKIEATLTALKVKTPAPVATAAPAPAPVATPSEADPLAKVLTAIATLSADIKAQGQRLGRLEKGVGLPSSQATTERAPRARDGEVSWPLDMNAPVARGSVDKTVSFHDD